MNGAEEKVMFCVRMTKKTYEKVKEVAKKEGVSINGLFGKLITRRLSEVGNKGG